MGERVAVVGASGYTGGLVVGELAGRGVGVVALGRDRARLAALPAEAERKVVDVADRGALRDALDGCGAVVNCVGSFLEFGEAVVGAAVAAGVPYVDTSGEFPFLQRVFDTHDVHARTAGVAVVPGMAFYSAPADMAAALAVRALGRPPDRVEIAYRLDGARPSKGTLRTNLRRAGLPCPVLEDGRLVPHRVGDDPRSWSFPEPYGPSPVARWPGGEVLTVPRHTGARSVAVFLGMPKAAAAVLRNPRLVPLLQRVGRAVVGQTTAGPSDSARDRARFAVVVEARAGGDVRRGVVQGHDLYGVTAVACAEAVQRLTAGAGGAPPAGALAPAEAFDPASFLDSLSGYLSWRIEG
jgi:short subunit dehydrogenase-like uncharacterized protein